jgi:uncharacterized coiled-coil protein SlyX
MISQECLVKTKKIALYVFAVIGILALVFMVYQSVISWKNRYYYGYGIGGGAVGLGAPVPAVSDYLTKEEASSNSNNVISSPAEEGVLTQRKIVKNGSLSLLVKKAEETAASIAKIASDFNGYVSYSQIYEVSEGVKAGTVTIRLPADKFSEATAKIKELAVKVQNEESNTSDITEQFVDLESRLKNLQAEEQQYLNILKQAVKVQDILEVSQRLFEVRGNIEQIQGQLKYLSQQVDMSTISVSLTSESEVKIFGLYWRPLANLKQSLRKMFEGLTGYVDSLVKLVFALPVMLLWLVTAAVIAFLGWKVLRFVWKKFFSPKV